MVPHHQVPGLFGLRAQGTKGVFQEHRATVTSSVPHHQVPGLFGLRAGTKGVFQEHRATVTSSVWDRFAQTVKTVSVQLYIGQTAVCQWRESNTNRSDAVCQTEYLNSCDPTNVESTFLRQIGQTILHDMPA
eukprot:scaffold22610_cov115-Cylindrotheca_fusiformis.AAC.5